jgi:elongation factor G
LDVPPMEGTDPEDKSRAVNRRADPKEPFSALAFKITADPFVGQLTYLRVYSGRVNTGDSVLNVTRKSRQRLGRILLMHANKREELASTRAGEIVAVVGLKNSLTGDTLCDPAHPVLLESIVFPEPVMQIAIEPKTKADQDRMGDVLFKMVQEDPTFRVKSDPETGQTLISGMGELHLEIIVDRMLREYKLQASVGKPQVAYRETVTLKVQAEGKFIRQTGGRGQYGHVILEVEPKPPGSGFEFEVAIRGGSVPREYFKAIERGVQEAMESGVLAGYPMVDLKVRLLDGSYHEVDSSDLSFKIAASMGFKEACKKAEPIFLEPIMRTEVVSPEEYTSNVLADLNGRRAKILGMEPRVGIQVVNALVPLAQMFGYSTDLRSATQGRAAYTMEFHHYSPVPAQLAREILAKYGYR